MAAVDLKLINFFIQKIPDPSVVIDIADSKIIAKNRHTKTLGLPGLVINRYFLRLDYLQNNDSVKQAITQKSGRASFICDKQIFSIKVEPLTGADQYLLIEFFSGDSQPRAGCNMLLEHNNAVILVVDIETRKIIRASRAAADFYKTDTETLVGSSFDKLQQDPQFQIDDFFKRASAAGVTRYRTTHKLFNNSFKDVEVYPSTTNETAKKCLLLTIHDISDFIEAQNKIEKQNRELAQHKERLNLLTEVSFEGLVITDNGIIVECNQAFARLLKDEREKMIGRNVLEYISPGQRSIVKRNITEKLQILYKTEGLTTTGETIPIEVQARMVPYEDKTLRVSGVKDLSWQIEARRHINELENLYSSIIESTREGFLIADNNNIITQINSALAEMLGLDQNMVKGQPVLNFVAEADKSLVQKKIAQQQTTHHRSYQVSLKRGKKDNLPVFVQSTNLYDDKGERTGVFAFITDFSQRIEYEKKLKTQQEEIQSILDSQKTMLVVTDLQTVINYNRSFASFFGFKVSGRAAKSNTNKEKLDNFLKNLMKQLKLPSSFKRSLTERKYFNAGVSGLIGKNGQNTYCSVEFITLGSSKEIFLITINDITEHHEYRSFLENLNSVLEEKVELKTHELFLTNRTLRKNRERLKDVQQVAHFGYWEYHAKTDSFTVSKDLRVMLGHNKQKAELSYDQFTRDILPSDKKELETKIKNSQKAMHPFNILLRFKQPEGSIVYIQSRCKPSVSDEGQVNSWHATARDISDIKSVEQALVHEQRLLNSIVQTSPVGIMLLDKNNRLLFFNNHALSIFSLETKQVKNHIIDFSAYRFFDENNRPIKKSEMPFTRIKLTHESVKNYQMIAELPELKKSYFLSINGAPLFDEEDEFEGAVFIFEDVTRQKMAESQHRQQEQILVQKSKMAAIGEMVGAITHQWRQPLSSIGLLVQDIEDAAGFNQLDHDYIRKTVKDIMQQIAFMSQTIDDFRNFFLPSKKPIRFDMVAVCGQVVDLVQHQFRDHGIDIEFKQVNRLGSYMSTGYPNEIKQVVLNLLNNARDAIFDKKIEEDSFSGKIFIKMRKIKKVIKAEVADNAGGIPDDLLAKIFEPFFSTKQEKGTGVGLSLSRTIIENMNGTLEVANGDTGAVFTINLPEHQQK